MNEAHNADTVRRRCVDCDNVSMGAVREGWRCPVCRGVMKRWPKRIIVIGDDGVDVIDPELNDGEVCDPECRDPQSKGE